MDMERGQVELEALLRFLRSAVGELLRRQDADEFLSWMESQAPERFPEVFSGMDERVVRSLALELGRQIWNATPLPRNGFQPLVLPPPAGQEPPSLSGLTPELIGGLVATLIADTAGGVPPDEE